MKTLIQGEIINFIPIFRAYVREGLLIFDHKGDIPITVDTGFNGGIMLPQMFLNEMSLEFIGYDTFTIATEEIIELPMFIGKVLVRKQEIKTWFIPGDALVGLEFLYSVGRILRLDFLESTVKLLK